MNDLRKELLIKIALSVLQILGAILFDCLVVAACLKILFF